MAAGKADTAKKSGKKSKLDFEQAMARLEEVVRGLEAGDVPLEASLEAFEEGMSLVRVLHERLDGVQQKIEELVRHADGKAAVERLD